MLLSVETAVSVADLDAAPVHHVPALGPALFEWEGPPRVLAGASPSVRIAPDPYVIHWQLLDERRLLVQLVHMTGSVGHPVTGVLEFEVPLLPAVHIFHWDNDVQIAALTADGALHTVRLEPVAVRQKGLAVLLAEPGVLRATPLGAALQRAGRPSALIQLRTHTCVGTDDGNIVCVPGESLDAAKAFELRSSGGALSKVLGGLLGFSTGSGVGVLHMLDARVVGQEDRVMVTIHTGFTIRVWEMHSRRMLFGGDLLPPDVAQAYEPKLARISCEMLDSNQHILVVVLEPRDPSRGCEIRHFQIYLEPRGHHDFKVLVEAGSILQSGVHRVVDLSLETLGPKYVGIWLLHDTAGRRSLQRVPFAHLQPITHTETNARLVEDQMGEITRRDSQELQDHLWKAFRDCLQRAGDGAPPRDDALAAAFLPVVLGPGHLSRPALAVALEKLGCGVSRESVLQTELPELAEHLPAWVARATGSGGVAGWHAFLRTYAAAFRAVHLPIAVLPQNCPEVPSMVLVRQAGALGIVRPATASEYAAQGKMASEWADKSVGDMEAVDALLEAAAEVGDACGGLFLGRLVVACAQRGLSAESDVLPALLEAVTSGGPGPGAAAWHARWRARCRRLPLDVIRLCGVLVAQGRLGFALQGCVAAIRNQYGKNRLYSECDNVVGVVRTMACATAAQVCASQVQAAGQLLLLVQYMARNMGWAGTEPPSPQGGERSPAREVARTIELAGVAYWGATTPVKPAHAKPEAADPASMVMSLTIDEAAVFDMAELVSFCMHFTRYLWSDGASLLSNVLFRQRATAQLMALSAMLPDPSETNLLFFKACGLARSVGTAPPAERKRVEAASVAAFFRLAAVVALSDQPLQMPASLRACLEQLNKDLLGSAAELVQELPEVQIYRIAHLLFQRLGASSASCAVSLAAVGEMEAAGPGGVVALLQQQSRLWASVFADCLEGGAYAAAYAAALSAPEPETKVDCVQRLAHALCTAEGVPLLCRLPFADNVLPYKGGVPSKTSLLEEVLATLHRRADNLDLAASPQPYQARREGGAGRGVRVLYDLYISRGNYQAAAGAMLHYASRVKEECSVDAAMLQKAGEALSMAVAALRLLPRQDAWIDREAFSLLGSGAAVQQSAALAGATPGSEEADIVTLADLECEYAVARAHAAVAAAMPGGEATSPAPQDVFEQCLTLGLHDAAFMLAEALYSGSALQRALRKVFWAAAASTALLQLQSLPSSDAASSVGAAWDALEHRLLRCEGKVAVGAGMRLTVVDAVLSADSKCDLPPWLLLPFKTDATQDAAGLLRTLMRHGRLADAAELAAAHLRSVSTVPSMAMGTPAAVCLPQELLDVLLQRLERVGSSDGARRKDRIFLSIDLVGCHDVKLDVKNDEEKHAGLLSFSAKAQSHGTGPDEHAYQQDLELYSEIDDKDIKQLTTDRYITLAIAKKDPTAPFWPRLLKAAGKPPQNIKVDWDKWQDEDEEDEGPGGMPGGFDMSQFESFGGMGGMGGMGGLGGMGGMGDLGGLGSAGLGGADFGAGGDGSDSDDEDLPDLEPAGAGGGPV
eukprot:scaffold15.g4375.t1